MPYSQECAIHPRMQARQYGGRRTPAEQLERPAPLRFTPRAPVLLKGALGRRRAVAWLVARRKLHALVHVLCLGLFVHILLTRAQNARVHQRAGHHGLRV